MNDFTASNGIIVAFVGSSQRWTVDPLADGGDYANVTEAQMQALREFFQAEADERLGRWRWPENPNYVVYPCSVKTRVRVLRESGTGDLEWVDQGDVRSYEFVHAARAYFDAPPEPKPWHDAAEGDVWLITYNAAEFPAIFQDGEFRDHGGTWVMDRITAARKLWPEVSS